MVSQSANQAFLKTKPSLEKAQLVLKKCTANSLKNIIEEIDDDFYLAGVLASFDRFGLVELNTFLESTDDLYLRDLLYAKFEYGLGYSIDEVRQYKKIKEDFLQLKTEEEKVEYIQNISFPDEQDNKNLKANIIKKSLLQNITNPKNREKVIESLTPQIDKKYKDYVEIVKKMILDFFSKNGKLTPEMKERISIVFKTYNVEDAELDEEVITKGSLSGSKGINGDCNHLYRRIRVNKNIIYPEEMLNVLLHEYAHALTHEDIVKKIPFNEIFLSDEGTELEEGMVETFAETILNDYLKSHNEIIINGKSEKIYYPYVSGSYDEFVLISKSLLCGLENSGEDIEYMQQYFFGDKKAFYDKVQIGEIFSLSNKKGSKVKLTTSKEMIETLIRRIGNDNHKSRYNDGLEHISFLRTIRDTLSVSNEEDKEKIINLTMKFLKFKGNRVETREIDEIFDNRDLGELSQVELDFVGKLLPIYFPNNNDMTKERYINYKLRQLALEKGITINDAKESLKLIADSVSQERGINPNDRNE